MEKLQTCVISSISEQIQLLHSMNKWWSNYSTEDVYVRQHQKHIHSSKFYNLLKLFTFPKNINDLYWLNSCGKGPPRARGRQCGIISISVHLHNSVTLAIHSNVCYPIRKTKGLKCKGATNEGYIKLRPPALSAQPMDMNPEPVQAQINTASWQ